MFARNVQLYNIATPDGWTGEWRTDNGLSADEHNRYIDPYTTRVDQK